MKKKIVFTEKFIGRVLDKKHKRQYWRFYKENKEGTHGMPILWDEFKDPKLQESCVSCEGRKNMMILLEYQLKYEKRAKIHEFMYKKNFNFEEKFDYLLKHGCTYTKKGLEIPNPEWSEGELDD